MKIIQKISAWLTMLLATIRSVVTKHIEPSIKIVNIIKQIVDDPALKFITDLTPNKWDDVLLHKVRDALAVAIEVLNISKTCNNLEDPNERIACLIKYLRTKSPFLQTAIYSKLATLVAIELSKQDAQELTEKEADTLVQLVYAKGKF